MTIAIDLRSDTATKPTAPMRQAMVEAEVGDDQKGEDPTVDALQRRVAALLGHEAALFMPTATMANQIGLQLLSQPGDELLAERRSHVLVYELGGPAIHSGLLARPIDGQDGQFTPAQLAASFRAAAWDHSGTTLLSIENTHAEAGGRVWDWERLDMVVHRARDLKLRLRLDGARLLNASVATGLDPALLARPFDAVTFRLSKGIGCPAGALIVGSDDLVQRARRLRLRFGGALRQAGILAAAGLYALDHHVQRLAVDHANARLLARLVTTGLGLPHIQVDTNIVLLEIGKTRMSTIEATKQLRDRGVLVSTTAQGGVLRAVTHLDITEADVRHAAEQMVEVLNTAGPVGVDRG